MSKGMRSSAEMTFDWSLVWWFNWIMSTEFKIKYLSILNHVVIRYDFIRITIWHFIQIIVHLPHSIRHSIRIAIRPFLRSFIRGFYTKCALLDLTVADYAENFSGAISTQKDDVSLLLWNFGCTLLYLSWIGTISCYLHYPENTYHFVRDKWIFL